MPIVYCDIDDESGSHRNDWSRRYALGYLVMATTDMDIHALLVALQSSPYGLIPFGSFPTDSGSFCEEVAGAVRDRNVGCYYNASNPSDVYNGTLIRSWSVTATFGPVNANQVTETGDPLAKPIEVEVDSVNTKVPFILDVDGNPVVNSAGDFYNPPREIDQEEITVIVYRNEPVTRGGSYPSVVTLLQYSNRLNEATWNGFPPLTVKMDPFKLPKREYSQFAGTYYYAMTYVFRVNFNTWRLAIPDLGFRQVVSGKLQNIVLADGSYPTEPMPLNGAGSAVLSPAYQDTNEGSAPDEPTGTTEDTEGTGTGTGSTTPVVINEYEGYRPLDYSLLNLDGLPI